MLADELELWEDFGTVQPSAVLTLDDVPVALMYSRDSIDSDE